MKNTMFRLGALLATLLALAAPHASACVPIPPRPALPLDHVQNASHIFIARLDFVRVVFHSDGLIETHSHFKVGSVFKGDPPDELSIVSTNYRGSSCSDEGFSFDKIYVFLPGMEDFSSEWSRNLLIFANLLTFTIEAEAEAWIRHHLALIERFAEEPPLELDTIRGEAPLTVRLAEPSQIDLTISRMDEEFNGYDPAKDCVLIYQLHPGVVDGNSRPVNLLIDWDAFPYLPYRRGDEPRRVEWKLLYEDECPVREITYLLPGTYTVRATIFAGTQSDPEAYLFRRSATVTVLAPSETER